MKNRDKLSLAGLCGFVVIFFLLLNARLLYIYLDSWIHRDDFSPANKYLVTQKRYSILDRNENIIATDIASYDLYLTHDALEIDPLILNKLLGIFPDLNLESMRKRLARHTKGVVLVKKSISEEQKQMLYKYGIAAIYLEQNYVRFYPYGNLFAHIVGYTSIDRIGLAGLEKKFNKNLFRGNIITSLDLKLQSLLYNKLQNTQRYFDSKGAFGVIVDLETYEILASVSLPDYDPNLPLNPNSPVMLNSIVSAAFEPGSVFKIFTLAFGIKNGLKPDDVFELKQNIFLGGGKFVRDDHSRHSEMTLSEIFYRSSNIGMTLLTQRIGEEKFIKFLEDIKIINTNRVATNDLPTSEIAGIKHPTHWYPSEKITVSYGYGVSMSPLYLLNIVSGIFNDGKLKSFTLIKDANNNTKYTKIYNKNDAKIVKQIAAEITKSGTARRANVGKFEICGKTGTAEKYDRILKRWDGKRKLTSFVAIFPCEQPKYAIYVGFNEPKYTENARQDNYTPILQGGTVAAPSEIISTIFLA